MRKITFLLLLFTAGIFSQTIQMPNIPEDGVVYETKTLNSTFSIPPADSWDFSDFEPVDEYDITMLPIENTSVLLQNILILLILNLFYPEIKPLFSIRIYI